jgi:hypothetical protein
VKKRKSELLFFCSVGFFCDLSNLVCEVGKKDSNGNEVNIYFDKPYYLGGEVVTGKVVVNLRSGVKANHLAVKFVGKEKTKIENTVHYQDAQGNPQSRRETHTEKKEFFKQQFILQQFAGGMIAPGMYTLPFQYQLPVDLPGVFYDDWKEHDGDKVKGAIMYKVKVCLDIKGSDLEDKEFLIVNSAFTKVPKAIVEKKDKKFLFGGSGKLTMTAMIAKDVFLPGETVYIKLEANNESKKEVRKFKVKLMRTVKIKAQGRTVVSVREIQRKQFPGVQPKNKSEQMLDLALAPQTFPSSVGKLVSCEYHLDIEADVPMAGDLELHPKIAVALLPIAGQPVYNPFAMYVGFK